MILYNTKTRKKETFTTLEPGVVKMYVCGPTVYDYLHVGNFRGAVTYNLLRSWLEKKGYKVSHVYNYTDIDDKIIARAEKEGVTWEEIATRYIAEFEKDFSRLGLKKPHFLPRVSEHLEDIFKMTGSLVSRGRAYLSGSDVYFSVQEFPSYGKLSGRSLEETVQGTRVELEANKKFPLDFALWKSADSKSAGWNSPWGWGRPGWHIECSAMSKALLGEQIDIHGGGLDLLFPHHENEVAQSEACSDKEFSRFWVHHNLIEFHGTKMSKSLGNVRTARSFMDEFGPEVLKMLYLSSHYRSLVDFSESSIQSSIKALGKVYSALASCERHLAKSEGSGSGQTVTPFKTEWLATLEKARVAVDSSLSDDLNTPEVLAVIYELVRKWNSLAAHQKKEMSQEFLAFIKEIGEPLALFQEPPTQFLVNLDDLLLKRKNLIRSHVDGLVQERWKAKMQKDFSRADALREQLKNMGIAVQDEKDGSWWEVEK